MHTPTSLPGNDRLPIYPLEVFRVRSGESWFVKMLSEIGTRGLWTHWLGRHSVYCPGAGCDPAAHKKDRIWKGYTACEVWYPEPGYWRPWLLEITENLGVDLRHKYARGQVWELTRAPDQHGKRGVKHFPVCGRLSEQLPAVSIPPEFDFVPCLLRVYHRTDGKIDLTAKCPLPDRVYVEAHLGGGPKELGEAPPAAPPTEESRVQFRRRLLNQGIPAPSSNGTGH